MTVPNNFQGLDDERGTDTIQFEQDVHNLAWSEKSPEQLDRMFQELFVLAGIGPQPISTDKEKPS